MPFTCLDVVKAALGQPEKQSGDELYFRCPIHDDHDPSLMVNERKDVWLCGPCNKGGIPWELAAFLLGFDPSDKSSVMAWLQEHHLVGGNKGQPTSVSEYIYKDSGGQPALKVLRYEPKSFRQQRWDGTEWDWKGPKPKLLYRLPELLAAPGRWVFLCAGEKDADRLRSLSFVATTNPGGEGNWEDSYTETLKGRSVAILVDNDAKGHKHAIKVATALMDSSRVCVVELSG